METLTSVVAGEALAGLPPDVRSVLPDLFRFAHQAAAELGWPILTEELQKLEMLAASSPSFRPGTLLHRRALWLTHEFKREGLGLAQAREQLEETGRGIAYPLEAKRKPALNRALLFGAITRAIYFGGNGLPPCSKYGASPDSSNEHRVIRTEHADLIRQSLQDAEVLAHALGWPYWNCYLHELAASPSEYLLLPSTGDELRTLLKMGEDALPKRMGRDDRPEAALRFIRSSSRLSLLEEALEKLVEARDPKMFLLGRGVSPEEVPQIIEVARTHAKALGAELLVARLDSLQEIQQGGEDSHTLRTGLDSLLSAVLRGEFGLGSGWTPEERRSRTRRKKLLEELGVPVHGQQKSLPAIKNPRMSSALKVWALLLALSLGLIAWQTYAILTGQVPRHILPVVRMFTDEGQTLESAYLVGSASAWLTGVLFLASSVQTIRELRR